MKYKLIENDTIYDHDSKPSKRILFTRGINDPDKYINLDDNCLYDYSLLNNIDRAVKCCLEHINNQDDIAIVVDPDADGQCSAAVLYQYLKELFPKISLITLFHTKKQHGIDDINVPNNIKLLLVPDAGSNDVEKSKQLSELGISLIYLDHHEKSCENPYAIIVNPKWDNYPNKELSGCAVVYKFLQAMDNELWENKADKYLDLVALSLISDSMDLKSYETKRLVDKGLSNIKNKLFIALINKQEYSIGGEVTIQNIQFYLSPLVNGMIRSAGAEEKAMMFRAFCQIDEWFDYQKRGETEIVKEDIYTRTARIATNSKAKQNREIDKSLEVVKKDIEKYKWDNNKILFVKVDDLDSSYTGLVSMRLASQYSKPCVLIRETSWKPGYLGGSARNIDNSPIENLKDFLWNTGMFSMCQGHQSAFGVELKIENIKGIISKTNDLLKDTSFEKVYAVDFEMLQEYVTIDFVQEIDKMKGLWGQGISEPLILVENIKLNTKDIKLMGKENDTFKFELNDENVVAIKFKCNENDKILEMIKGDWGAKDFEITAVGKVSLSNFNGIITPQFVIIDYNLV